MNRVLAAARLHLVHPLVVLGIPWLIVGCTFALALVTRAATQDGSTGGLAALYVTVLAVYVQAVTQLLPFAMGVSLSRRTFFLGTALMAGAQSLAYGVALTVLTAVEDATGGWGVGMAFWAPGPLDVDNSALQVLVFAVPMLVFAFVGVGLGVLHKRWGGNAVWALIVAVMVVLGGLSVLVSSLGAWDDVGTWVSSQSLATLALGLPALLAAGAAALGYAGIRRLVP